LSGVKKGTLLSIAFSPKFLMPAVTGEISHEKWIKNVGEELAEIYTSNIFGTIDGVE